MSAQTRAREHYQRQQTIAVAAVAAARAATRNTSTRTVSALAALLRRYQLVSATTSSASLAREAARAPVAQPSAFTGYTGLGYPVEMPLQTIVDQIDAAHRRETALLTTQLDMFIHSEVIEAGRAAGSVEIVTEPDWTNYVRVLNPPSCDRCAVLAGRIYRDLDGFFRHPLCDCQHWPVTSWEEAHDEGLLFSASSAFERGQIRGLSQADEQAIRDGADIAKVVNAKRGMYSATIFGRDVKATTEGVTRRGDWRRANPNRPVRLRPESIYAAATDRDDAIRLLGVHGFIAA